MTSAKQTLDYVLRLHDRIDEKHEKSNLLIKYKFSNWETKNMLHVSI